MARAIQLMLLALLAASLVVGVYFSFGAGLTLFVVWMATFYLARWWAWNHKPEI